MPETPEYYDEDDLSAITGMDLEAPSAEEAAMQVVDEPPGLSYDEEPGYLRPG